MSNHKTFVKERRKFPRADFALTNWIFALERNVDPAQPFRLEARNISLGGIKFITNTKIALFDEIQMQLFHKQGKEDPMSLSAKVTRVEEIDTGKNEKLFGIAAAFTPLASSTQDQLQRLLSTLSS